jgi:hypothetical protein
LRLWRSSGRTLVSVRLAIPSFLFLLLFLHRWAEYYFRLGLLTGRLSERSHPLLLTIFSIFDFFGLGLHVTYLREFCSLLEWEMWGGTYPLWQIIHVGLLLHSKGRLVCECGWGSIMCLDNISFTSIFPCKDNPLRSVGAQTS